MKIAVSIPDHVYQQAERIARRLKKSRSQLYAEALAEYLSQRDPTPVTDAIDKALEAMPGTEQETGFVRRAGRKTLRQAEW